MHNKMPISNIRNEENKSVVDRQELLDTWKNYTSRLFYDNRSLICSGLTDTPSGPSILKSEVTHAIISMKSNKASGPDIMYSKTFHTLNKNSLAIVVKVFNQMYDIWVASKDWLRSTFITITKSPNAIMCRDYRLISLMSHFLKLLLRVIHTKLYKK